MEAIQMVDLKRQYLKIKTDIDKAILQTIDSTAYINGPQVSSFETNLASYLSVRNVIACANGTDALQIALMALSLKPGDEVITADFTFAATVEVIALLGLTPVLVDVDLETFTLDASAVERAISARTKAIIPVHLFGQCASMEPLLALAKKHNLFIIEDTAQAIGAEAIFSNGAKHKAGTLGHIGTTSFFPSKNLGCFGDGGALFTQDDALAQRIRALVNHGMYKRYYHDEIGINSRLDSLQAAVLNIKLQHLDHYNMQRQKAANYYDLAFADVEKIKTPIRSDWTTHVYHQYTLKVAPQLRNGLRDYLESKGIPSMIYYPVALQDQKAYESLIETKHNCPITKQLTHCVLSLPMHSELSEDQLAYITYHTKEYISKHD